MNDVSDIYTVEGKGYERGERMSVCLLLSFFFVRAKVSAKTSGLHRYMPSTKPFSRPFFPFDFFSLELAFSSKRVKGLKGESV